VKHVEIGKEKKKKKKKIEKKLNEIL